jgi:hypothetical protein
MPANRGANTSGDRRSRFTGPNLPRTGAFSATPFEEPVEILVLEAEAAAVAELGGRDRALARPSADRLLMYAEIGRRLGEPCEQDSGERD